MVIVFDLDDTLYEELSYVKSGFRQVSKFMEQAFSIPAAKAYPFMRKRLRAGRHQIFDETLKIFNCYSKKNVQKCLNVYRQHKPSIRLWKNANHCLNAFRDVPLYLVTDGNKIVQHNKILALGLSDRMKFCFITHIYGIKKAAKPSPYCFFKICERENVSPGDVIYVGDNPVKDFIGLNKLGFKTIRVLTGAHKGLSGKKGHDASVSIKSLRDLNRALINKIRDEGS